ncbi:uncharacterized protein LOC110724192 isoform X1 [Chenopodium quinoa]|uniref:uncharacterized protein LOC110724192 isoform X1 n=1 Tax=Chenopodium quinoa TaxID=63459 RepID=UPI000B76D2B9|nr:uncharacterized protein LOC110724192 isoform X1 [Chenopodium quinoa]XP_021759288.1 uncharacterized protein LOC110724192 isoform X1 [Chenopodium quinoa]XP_021759289.1 uncharacterized protein LOC110724192 isoform X1 [Chenopodium quinoa]XP_021759290.1 uncharacterized protein LOC110724192 isoform X1 [Chenopodium quinoa]
MKIGSLMKSLAICRFLTLHMARTILWCLVMMGIWSWCEQKPLITPLIILLVLWLIREGPSIIQCDRMNATQRDYYGVIDPQARLGHQYVRTTSKLYTKYWAAAEFLNRRKRILIDSSYVMMIKAKEKDYALLARKYGKPLLNIPTDEIRLFFFPVLDGSAEKADEHWWCLCMDMVKKQFWMIDSLYSDPYEHHSELVTKLVKAVDVLLQVKDPRWELGSLEKGPRNRMDMVKQTNTFSCGVLMLGCIKHCARISFDTSYPMVCLL